MSTFDKHPYSYLWHPTRNNGVKPSDIGLNSHKPCWFKCDKEECQYDFTAIPHNNKKKLRCKHCIGDELCGIINCKICFHRTLASYEGVCCGAKNKNDCEANDCNCGVRKIDLMIIKDDVQPIKLHLQSNRNAEFKCNKCPHTFPKVISQLPNNSWCSYCANQTLCEQDDCDYCYHKSFASHPRATCWVQTKNGCITPRMKLKGSSNEEYWFNCKICLHCFKSDISSITNTKKPSWCPYCANQKLCEDDDCKLCYEKSFASHLKAQYWNQTKNGAITPRMKHLGSDNEKYWFTCYNCPHEFDACIYHITHSNSWCPYCCFPPLLLCKQEHCMPCYEKSFASHPKAQYWNQTKNGAITPRMVFKNCNSNYNLICEKGHDIYMQINNINTGHWCSSCINKTEQKLYELLCQIYPMLEKQYKVEWCKNILFLPFDFVLKELKIIIELDGPQHFIQTSNWKSPEETRKVDLYKIKCANDNGFSVIRIMQVDVYYDKYDWLGELDASIKKIIEEGLVQNIYLCKNNEYEDFRFSFRRLFQS